MLFIEIKNKSTKIPRTISEKLNKVNVMTQNIVAN